MSANTKPLSEGRIGKRSGKKSVVPTLVKALSVLFIMSENKESSSAASAAVALEFPFQHISCTFYHHSNLPSFM